jgi:uncharacterized membrane protein YhaH (DUF805 family)
LKGNVIGFDRDANTGAISGHDGGRYDFTTSDWHSHSRPQHGDLVDFVAGDQRATQIYLIEPEYVAPGFVPFYFSPSGRISRSQYWLKYFVPVLVIGLILSLLQLVGGGFQILSVLFQLAVAWPGVALLVKRIHDRNKSGWLVWVLYGPMILAVLFSIAAIFAIALSSSEIASLGMISGILWIIVVAVAIWFFVEFGCMRGTVGVNQYGADPVSGS